MTLIQALVAASAVTIIAVEMTWFRLSRIRIALVEHKLNAEIQAFQLATDQVSLLVNDLREELRIAREARGA
jgi:hypothetical protein